MTRRGGVRQVAVVALALSAGACLEGATITTEPTIASVTPDSAREGERLRVTIRGSNFLVRPLVDLVAGPRADGEVTAQIGALPLQEVEVVSPNELAGYVDPSLPKGTWDVSVTNGFGHTSVARASFTVVASTGSGVDAGARADGGPFPFDAGPEDGGGADAGLSDAGAVDAGESDAGAVDAGDADAGASDAGVTDAGVTDAGVTDAGVTDAGVTDAGVTDAGVTDAGVTDAGVTDAGMDDAGMTDAGMTDAGMDDAGMDDAGLADAGMTDAGMADAGMADAGVTDAGVTDAGVSDAGVTDAGMADAGEAALLFVDPFGDGTTSTFVFGYQGRVFLGPNRTGTGAVSSEPDGTDPQSSAFAFQRDSTGNTSSNSSPAPYPSIGATGCTNNSPACGPDNENGRGLFFETTMADAGWVGAAGARSGQDLDYVYFARGPAATLQFAYVDLSAFLGGGTRMMTSAAGLAGRSYLGFGGTSGAKRPTVVVLLVPPALPGLDATTVHVVDLEVDGMPGISNNGGATNHAMVDAMATYADRLYLGAYGGWMRSTTSAPRSYQVAAADWAVCTPTHAAYVAKTSTTTTRAADLEPADRAVPAFATFAGRLYAARNTTAGPQLWACNPALTVSPTDCDPGDWFLVAPNVVGDPQLTQFGDANHQRISLLRATPTHLYVGFNNASRGVVLFRTQVLAPTTLSHFTGAGGCPAANYPSSCSGYGGNGFGAGAAVPRVFDSTVLPWGGTDFVYVVAGDGVAPARVYRVGP